MVLGQFIDRFFIFYFLFLNPFTFSRVLRAFMFLDSLHPLAFARCYLPIGSRR